MINIKRTTSENPDFKDLISLLDEDLAIRDGDDHAFYAQYNKITMIKHAIVAYSDDVPVGTGAIKTFDEARMEVKRMYVLPSHRGRGLAVQILNALEEWAKELGATSCILETGQKQPEAIALYQKSGYHIIPNYGQYVGIENSVCFEKEVR